MHSRGDWVLNFFEQQHTGCPRIKVTDLMRTSAKNLARISRREHLNRSSIVKLKIDTLLVDLGALRVEILVLKA